MNYENKDFFKCGGSNKAPNAYSPDANPVRTLVSSNTIEMDMTKTADRDTINTGHADQFMCVKVAQLGPLTIGYGTTAYCNFVKQTTCDSDAMKDCMSTHQNKTIIRNVSSPWSSNSSHFSNATHADCGFAYKAPYTCSVQKQVALSHFHVSC